MKQFTTIFTVMLMAALSLSLVSCDEDAEVAATLAGTWQGNVDAYSRYNGREYRAAESKVQFNSGYNSGDGYWIDYYNDAPYSYQASHITWYVRNTNIYIHFEEDNTNVVVYNYTLSDDRLSGYIQTGNGQMPSLCITVCIVISIVYPPIATVFIVGVARIATRKCHGCCCNYK